MSWQTIRDPVPLTGKGTVRPACEAAGAPAGTDAARHAGLEDEVDYYWQKQARAPADQAEWRSNGESWWTTRLQPRRCAALPRAGISISEQACWRADRDEPKQQRWRCDDSASRHPVGPHQSRSSTVRVRMTGRRVVRLWAPLHHYKARLLQMSDQPVRGDARHHAVSVVDTLATVIAECKRQCLGEFIGRCRAKGWGFRHSATLPRLSRTKQELARLTRRQPANHPGQCAIVDAVGRCRCAPYLPAMSTTVPIRVNRAPVLTLWAAIVAERLGHPPDTAMTLGRFVAGSSARAKARSLGIADESQDATERQERAAAIKAQRRVVRLLGREVPVLPADDGTLRAEDKGKPASAGSVRSYVMRAFGERLGEVREAMEALARSLTPGELNRVGFRLYERFRPEVPAGAEGWGAKGELRIERIQSARG